MSKLVRFLKEDQGQDFVEYALLLAAIGLIGIAVVPSFRNKVIEIFQTAISNIAAAAGQ